MMNELATPNILPSIRHTVIVEAPIERAFEVFTANFDRWWPRTHKIGQSDVAQFVIELREDGRCYERGVDGVECDWGRVRVWDPPAHLVIAWHLDADWKFDPDPERASEVEVRFFREADKRTRVELSHHHIERHARGVEIHKSVNSEGGWPGLLKAFKASAEG